MAEYNDVIKHFKRMCRYTNHSGLSNECPLYCKGQGCNIDHCRKLAFEKPAHFAATVMQWAKEHPEPVYPTWWKYLCMIGIIPDTLGNKTLGEVTVDRLMSINIPPDIAERLGLKPKEG